MTSVGGTTYTYRKNGNVTATDSLDYNWNWHNRLASADRELQPQRARDIGGVGNYQ